MVSPLLANAVTIDRVQRLLPDPSRSQPWRMQIIWAESNPAEITNLREVEISTRKPLRFCVLGFYVERDIVGHPTVQPTNQCLHARYPRPRSRSASYPFPSTFTRLPSRRRVSRSTCCTRSATGG